ncbi:nucleic-acid-binding protein from transposon X-element [Trichonephila clavipes]|uniref:Nucleic-acid-binding protein from transposon X-element n=1 Tax=Trichonephila clavipes TaxID=2585209 RepID=A0A8X6SDC6_TRICX|nr:nucleic-acid-binding protein from transposon X-element [Trichonephila clavipes]
MQSAHALDFLQKRPPCFRSLSGYSIQADSAPSYHLWFTRMGNRSHHPHEKDSSNAKQDTPRHDERTLNNLVSELRTLPPCLDPDCTDHTIISKENDPALDNSKSNDKKKPKKRKCKKQDLEGFAFPTKSARLTTPTQVLAPIPTQNNFENLNQEPEPMIESNQENKSPIIKPPYPITLKTVKNYREQFKKISENFPNISIKTAGDYIKLFPKTEEEKGNLAHFLELDKDYQFYITQPKVNKPLKVVLKGLPRVSLPEDIQIDLEALGYTIVSCSQLISKRTKLELPFFLVTLLRNDKSTTIFDLTHLGFLQVRVEGYSINGVTQCYKYNNFFHTAANCFMKPRCLKCGKEHTTKECEINSRLENPYCINCHQYGHSACYTKCLNFPKPRKGSPTVNRTKNNPNFNSNKVVEGLSFANVLSGNTPISNPPQIEINSQESQNTSQSQINTEANSNETQNIMDLFKIIVNIVKQFQKLIQILPVLKATNDMKEQTFLILTAIMDQSN